MNTKRGRPCGQFTVESYMITNGKTGDVFFSKKKDKDLTAMASYRKRKITTERMLIVATGGKKPIAEHITKVTLI
ncbi:MAG: hypothetical protein WC466_08065 [Candidatus Izemoplasmatales bacterium]